MYAVYPVYYPSWQYAKEHDELSLWKESHKINLECRDYINTNAGHAYRNNVSPNSVDDFVNDLVEKYGLERAMFVTARFIVAADGDERYGIAEKARASQFDFRDMTEAKVRRESGQDEKHTTVDRTMDLYSNIHPCILNDLFLSLMKKEQSNLADRENQSDNELDMGVER